MSSRTPWWRIGLAGAIVLGLAGALRAAADDAGSVAWPDGPAIGVTAGLIGLTHVAGALSWLALFQGRGDRWYLSRAFVVGQLAKYVPGGVVQIAGLYEEARRAGVDHHDVAVGLPVHALIGTLFPCSVAGVALAVTNDGLSPAIRVVLVLTGAVLGLLLFRWQWLHRLLDAAHSRWGRIPPGTHVPSRRVLLKVAAWGSVSVAAYSCSAAVLLGLGDARESAIAAASFGVAMGVGLVAVPFPSGLGVREAVFAAAAANIASVADALAVALVMRAVQLVVEVVLGAVVLAIVARRPRGAGLSGPAS